ncbi:UNKNOWN [Stylonychia lemnae]|uniref:Uncharacterized protein n=1 Tax=Stylonychia lemnae TaxID=5949 RepID=A0A078A592_STYLE|nr:UNKNOWN [Stylonychia lemnae]|eukprot:CDW75919.1 UNKNOWN [Stylonychia lemnae]
MQDQKQTTNSIVFEVEIKDQVPSLQTAVPEIKKKLEEAAYMRAAAGPAVTLEQISEKLKRAEEKRRQTITVVQDSKLNRERRRIGAFERRISEERVHQDQLKEKLETYLNKAVEKRLTVREQRMQKLRNHISRVEEIRTQLAVRRNTSAEAKRIEIYKRLDEASLKREQQLVSKKITAMKSAEKKKTNNDSANAQTNLAELNLNHQQ